jgi:hypothetical protein
MTSEQASEEARAMEHWYAYSMACQIHHELFNTHAPDMVLFHVTAEIVDACHRLCVRRAISEELTSQDHRALLHDVHYVQLVEDMDAA